MRLTSEQEGSASGGEGEAQELAMTILVRVGDALGADSLVPIKSAHVLAHYSSLHEAGIEVLERFSSAGGRFAVPTTVDPSSIDLENWESFGIPRDYAEKQFRLCTAFEKLGGVPCWSCAQYQVCNFPEAGETLAWAESNSVVFANSILGCRTNKITSGLDIACAITGLTPRFGMLLKENRRASVTFRSTIERPTDLDYRSLGYYIGKQAGSRVPALEGLPSEVTIDELKHLGAAAAAAGPVTMIHYIGITPGSESINSASGGLQLEKMDVGRRELEEVELELNQSEETPDLVALGVPHLSMDELEQLSRLLAGRKLRAGTKMYVYTSSRAYDLAKRSGVLEGIERTGARLTHSTDAEISPLKDLGFDVVMTNSAKLAEIVSSEGEVKVRYSSLPEIVKEVTI